MALRRPLAELAPGLPPAWSEITLRALLGDPDARPTAVELALAYFDSAPCEPLRLVLGSDETSLLTQRLRQPAATAPAVVAPRRGSRTLGLLEPRRAAAFGTALLLVVGLAVGGLMAAGQIATPDWAHPSRDAAGRLDDASARVVPASSPAQGQEGKRRTSTTTVAVGADIATEYGVAQRDPRALMAALSTLRAEVMVSGSMTRLGELDAPGSEALAADTALLTGLASSGQSWEGVALRVTSARTVAQSEARATVDAVVETAAYRVVDASGRAQQRPEAAAEELRFELAWSGGRWRVASITDAAL